MDFEKMDALLGVSSPLKGKGKAAKKKVAKSKPAPKKKAVKKKSSPPAVVKKKTQEEIDKDIEALGDKIPMAELLEHTLNNMDCKPIETLVEILQTTESESNKIKVAEMFLKRMIPEVKQLNNVHSGEMKLVIKVAGQFKDGEVIDV